ncbi:PH domain-containing protein [Staphylococcus sp. SQ8-PEA]|uniref:PH domain-containing protein n=1 Tax=Staphylococcus marylandisciuri TaxID=2981529 RepID=A0ABT2QRH9_9STAP|nr:PH domain-containing protein [Staphylococcus marylandisciuri]MCU5746547.1 PH domain-containing protein [Staphylococcus marylandisciuri]
MTDQPHYHRSPKKALKYFYIISFLRLLFTLSILAVLLILSFKFNWWPWLNYIFYLFIAYEILHMFFGPLIDYYYTYYKVTSDYVVVDYRFFFKSREIVNIDRIQYLIHNQNPILLKLGLCETQVLTAGHCILIPFLRKEDIEEIETRIFERLREVNSDV